MPLLSALAVAAPLRAWLPALMLASTMLPYASGAMALAALSWLLPRRCYLWADNRMYDLFMSSCLFVFENCAAAKIHLYGDAAFYRGPPDRAVLISNHQSGADWVMINMLAVRHGQQHSFRFVIKHAIQYVPLYGWYTIQRGFVYVRRFGGFAAGPARRQLRYLGALDEPLWLHIFPEGTRFNAHKTRERRAALAYCGRERLPPLRHLLAPRAGGFALLMDELRDAVDCVYDLTIAYGITRREGREDDAPDMYEFFAGDHNHNEVHVHVRRHPIADVPTDPAERKLWLHQRFVEKDELLSAFYASGRFPDAQLCPAALTPLSRTLPAFLLLNGLVWAAWFSPRLRKTYAYTIALSPLLLLWTKLRGTAA